MTREAGSPPPIPSHEAASAVPGAQRGDVDSLLSPLYDFAHIVARSLETAPTLSPPRQLRTILSFTRLPRTARHMVRAALDDDDEFRAAVASRADESEVGRAGMLFLDRPDGWEEELAVLVDAGSNGPPIDDGLTAGALRVAAERQADLEGEILRLGRELDHRTAEVSRLEGDNKVLEERLAVLSEERDRFEEERGRAVRQWKDFERKASEWRAENLRLVESLERADQRAASLEARLVDQEPAAAATAEPPGLSRDDLRSLAELDDRLQTFISDLDGLKDRIGYASTSELVEDGEKDARRVQLAAVPHDPGHQGRRRPIRIGRGLHEDSRGGVESLLAMDDIQVLIDGYNVSMLTWPRLAVGEQRDRLLAATEALAHAYMTAGFHIFFDGAGDGGRQARGPVGSRVRVRFTPADVEADDAIIATVGDIEDHRGVVVVSNDRRVQVGARAGGANIVSASRFSEFL